MVVVVVVVVVVVLVVNVNVNVAGTFILSETKEREQTDDASFDRLSLGGVSSLDGGSVAAWPKQQWLSGGSVQESARGSVQESVQDYAPGVALGDSASSGGLQLSRAVKDAMDANDVFSDAFVPSLTSDTAWSRYSYETDEQVHSSGRPV